MRVWTVSERKAGTLTQCMGVARHLDREPHSIIIDKKLPRWRRGVLSPYRKMTRAEPDVIISCGSMAPRHVFAIADGCRKRPLTVHLQTPQPKLARGFDMAFISRHDWTDEKERSKFHKMLGVPHQFTSEGIREARPGARARLVKEEGPAVAVLIGGPNGAYRFEGSTVDELIGAITTLAASGWMVLVSTSRRSDPSMLERLLQLRDDHISVWDQQGENPYRDFIAAADGFVITKDTITMTCEALTTGQPVHIFDLPKTPCKKLDEFEWFHADMNELGLTRPFRGVIESYRYTPPDEARRIADLILERLAGSGRGENHTPKG